jgi:hypothetical protein
MEFLIAIQLILYVKKTKTVLVRCKHATQIVSDTYNALGQDSKAGVSLRKASSEVL